MSRLRSEMATGRLYLEEPSGVGLSLFLMEGSIVAAHAEDDFSAFARRVEARAALDQLNEREVTDEMVTSLVERLRGARGAVETYDATVELLPERLSTELLFDRFRENLTRFLAAAEGAEVEADPFTAMEAVFIPNIHLTHQSDAVVEEATALLERCKRLKGLDGTRELERGSRRPGLNAERVLHGLVEGPTTISQLLERSHLERHDTLDVLSDMLDGDALRLVSEKQEEELRSSFTPKTPRLSRREAYEIITHNTNALREIGDALDQANGPGAGRTLLRISADGGSSRFAALFHELPLLEGENLFDVDELFSRLRKRDSDERRALITGGLRELLDRTLSTADERLEPEQSEALLERLSALNG